VYQTPNRHINELSKWFVVEWLRWHPIFFRYSSQTDPRSILTGNDRSAFTRARFLRRVSTAKAWRAWSEVPIAVNVFIWRTVVKS